MPIPDLTPEYLADLDRKTVEMLDNPPPGVGGFMSQDPAFRSVLGEVFKSGIWLYDELIALGATDEQAQQIGFAHGQRCFGQKDVWEVAKGQLEKFKNGVVDVPGEKLAEEITEQVFPELSLKARKKARQAEFYKKFSKFVD